MEPGNLYKFDDSRLYLSRNSYASFYPWLTSAETPWCNGQPDVRIDYYNHHSKTEKNIVWFLLEPVKYWSKEDDQKYSMYKNVLNLWVTMKFLVDDF
ncbi:MAG: hypothetical protein GWN01_02280, partial [Nitrosopumilaceae archaeon]|nr:hypothetical protein [Nitrosopumilaceae archaeon]NIU88705.1 hypothetical protein [Nitrosopumilaceae archaeon]NIX60402.1 hypothetical protein [Nitrosopumilaceae archaeon]